MASRFRTVPNRLCCSSYLKGPGLVNFDINGTNSSKFSQKERVISNNNVFQVPIINNVSNHVISFSEKKVSCDQETRIPFPSDSLTSQDIITWYRQKNGLPRRYPSNSNETFRNALLLVESANDKSVKEPAESGRPAPEQLEKAFNTLGIDLPRLFVKPMDYSIYDRNLILENHIRGTRSVGVGSYVSQVALLRAVGHFKFAHVKFVVLKITKHPEDGTIKCRWRIQGVGGLKAVFSLFRFSSKKLADDIANPPTWYDGFSIYYLNSDGVIYKHVIDKMQPDDDKIVDEKPSITKLAMFLGVDPRKEQTTLMSILNDYFEDDSCLSKVMLPLDKIQ